MDLARDAIFAVNVVIKLCGNGKDPSKTVFEASLHVACAFELEPRHSATAMDHYTMPFLTKQISANVSCDRIGTCVMLMTWNVFSLEF